jgi:hypothetical protein
MVLCVFRRQNTKGSVTEVQARNGIDCEQKLINVQSVGTLLCVIVYFDALRHASASFGHHQVYI